MEQINLDENPAIWTTHKEKLPSSDQEVTFAEALEKTKFGIFNYLTILLSGGVLANVVLETAAMGFVLPISQCDLQLSTPQKGILSAVGYSGIIVSSHLWGFLADTKGRRAVIMPTLLVAFGLTVLSSFSHNFWVLATFRFLNGIAVSGGSGTIYAYLGEFHTDKTRSRAMMGSAVIFAVGAMVLPIVAFFVINQDWSLPIPFLGITYKPWRLFLVVCGIPGFLCGLSMLALPESPKFLLSVGKDEETISVLKTMHKLNTGKDESEFKAAKILPDGDIIERTKADPNSNPIIFFLRTMWYQTAPLFERQYLRATLIICFIQFWLFVTTNGMYMWFPDILNTVVQFVTNNPNENMYICDVVQAKHASLYDDDGDLQVQGCIEKLEVPTYFYSLFMEIMYAVGFALIGFVINIVGKFPVMFTVLNVFGFCGIAVIFVNIPVVAIYLYVFLFLGGLGINVLGATTVDLYPTHLRGMAICISLMIGRIGSVFGANIVAALVKNHCELTFWISGTSLVVCGFLAFFIPKGIKHVKTTINSNNNNESPAL